jgi:hypothetical protein
MMLSPWNSQKVVLAILGNTSQGVNWAATALVDSILRSQLGGSLAVINNKQVISSNTRYVVAGSGEISDAGIPESIVTPADMTVTDFPATRPGWILPVLIVSIGLILIIAVVVMVQNRSRINTRKVGEEAQRKDSEK